MTSDLHEGPLEPAARAPAPRTWREKRWERRRRRIWFEELLGWILVPIILVAGYWAVVSLLAAMGTSPSAVIEAVKAVLAGSR